MSRKTLERLARMYSSANSSLPRGTGLAQVSAQRLEAVRHFSARGTTSTDEPTEAA